MNLMPVDEAPRRGRPPSNRPRKITLQIQFDVPDAEAIEKLADKEGKTLSAMGRELALEGLAARKGKRK